MLTDIYNIQKSTQIVTILCSFLALLFYTYSDSVSQPKLERNVDLRLSLNSQCFFSRSILNTGFEGGSHHAMGVI